MYLPLMIWFVEVQTQLFLRIIKQSWIKARYGELSCWLVTLVRAVVLCLDLVLHHAGLHHGVPHHAVLLHMGAGHGVHGRAAGRKCNHVSIKFDLNKH